MKTPSRVALSISGLLMAACQGPNSPTTSGFGESLPQLTSAPASEGELSTSTSTSTSDANSTSSSGEDSVGASASSTTEPVGPLQDVGYVHDVGTQGPPGCKGKIDFLFVVSSQHVMQEVQGRVIAGFSAFYKTIAAKFQDFDYHIMVVDGNLGWGTSDCNEDCTPEGCKVPGYPCDLLDMVTSCDEEIGAGNVFNAGFNAPNVPCPVAGGRRYLMKGQPEPEETFACVARVGTSGSNKLSLAMKAALSPALLGPGGCNEGFLRDDALLMLTFVTGGYDWPSADTETPESWAQIVIDSKGGDAGSVVALGFFPPECAPDNKLCQMVKLFPYSLLESNLVDDYGAAFASATEMVAEACSEFIPQ